MPGDELGLLITAGTAPDSKTRFCSKALGFALAASILLIIIMIVCTLLLIPSNDTLIQSEPRKCTATYAFENLDYHNMSAIKSTPDVRALIVWLLSWMQVSKIITGMKFHVRVTIRFSSHLEQFMVFIITLFGMETPFAGGTSPRTTALSLHSYSRSSLGSMPTELTGQGNFWT